MSQNILEMTAIKQKNNPLKENCMLLRFHPQFKGYVANNPLTGWHQSDINNSTNRETYLIYSCYKDLKRGERKPNVSIHCLIQCFHSMADFGP